MLILVVLFDHFNLLKKFHNTSLSNTFRFYIIELCPIFILSLISLHGEGFSGTSLPVSKNGSMVPLDHLGNETRNAQALINVIIIIFWCENLVKIVHFSSIKSSLCVIHLFQLRLFIVCVMDNFNLIIAIYLDFSLVVPVFKMEHWPHPHSYFDTCAASVAFASVSPRTPPSFIIGRKHRVLGALLGGISNRLISYVEIGFH